MRKPWNWVRAHPGWTIFMLFILAWAALTSPPAVPGLILIFAGGIGATVAVGATRRMLQDSRDSSYHEVGPGPGGVLSVKRKLTDDEAEQLREQWARAAQSYSGLESYVLEIYGLPPSGQLIADFSDRRDSIHPALPPEMRSPAWAEAVKVWQKRFRRDTLHWLARTKSGTAIAGEVDPRIEAYGAALLEHDKQREAALLTVARSYGKSFTPDVVERWIKLAARQYPELVDRNDFPLELTLADYHSWRMHLTLFSGVRITVSNGGEVIEKAERMPGARPHRYPFPETPLPAPSDVLVLYRPFKLLCDCRYHHMAEHLIAESIDGRIRRECRVCQPPTSWWETA